MSRKKISIWLGKARRLVFCILSAALSAVAPSSTRASVRSAASPSRGRNQISIDEAERILPGKIIFESNRSGRFGIYSMAPDGSNITPIVVTDEHCLFPAPSVDGSMIAFAQTKGLDRRASSSIYLVNSDGTGLRKVADNATFPSFDPTGKKIYYERDRNKVIALDLESGREEEIFPRGNTDFAGFELSKPRLSADGKQLFIISDRPGRWHTWSVDLIKRESQELGSGCEPTPNDDGSKVVWVKKRSLFGKTSLIEKNLVTGEKSWLTDIGPLNGFKYFPTFAATRPVLLFSSGSGTERSHSSARYQVFAKDLAGGQCWQLTDDRYVNRWPRFLPAMTK